MMCIVGSLHKMLNMPLQPLLLISQKKKKQDKGEGFKKTRNHSADKEPYITRQKTISQIHECIQYTILSRLQNLNFLVQLRTMKIMNIFMTTFMIS